MFYNKTQRFRIKNLFLKPVHKTISIFGFLPHHFLLKMKVRNSASSEITMNKMIIMQGDVNDENSNFM